MGDVTNIFENRQRGIWDKRSKFFALRNKSSSSFGTHIKAKGKLGAALVVSSRLRVWFGVAKNSGI